MVSNFTDFVEEDIYSFKKWGAFGRFSTINSFPVEFFLTTLKSSELEKLTFARDIKPSSIDFEQLLQRDIDEDRVKNEIQPYLLSPRLTAIESMSKTVFFPPLLVAAIPVNRKKMEEYYSSQVVDDTDSKKVVREWSGLFRLNLGKQRGGFVFKPSMIDDKEISVSKEPAHIEINISNGIERGVKLIVIDGQHRLKALMEVYHNNPTALEGLALPICILYSPNATEEASRHYESSGFVVPTVSEIFRQMFVDVNKNAVQVGGHFNILLSEGNMGSLLCRDLCSYILEKRGRTGLAQIEWNQKNKKLSTEISKRYYLTSIGVLEKALSETFGKSKLTFNYLMHFDDIKKDVHPDGVDDHLEYPKVSWERFSFLQKKFIKKQLYDNLVPVLDKLYFETKLFSSSVKCFNDAIVELQKKASTDLNGETHYQPVLDFILDYMPISDGHTLREARHNYRIFDEAIASCKSDISFPLLGYAIFQRALILVWFEISKISKNAGLSPSAANELYISLLNEISDFLPNAISPQKGYCQSFIYIANRVNPTNDTRLGIAYLILSFFANKNNRDKILYKIKSDSFGESKRALDKIDEKLQDFAFYALNETISLFRKNRTKVFKMTYITDRGIDVSDREELQYAENERKQDEKDYKDGRITKDSISNKFEELVAKHVSIDVEEAKNEIVNTYSLDLDIFGLTELIDRSDYLESELDDASDFSE
ncbi:ParB N-terminal domain-containing protein [Aeromonas veronii]|uniref:DNA sulfur modification protein DndB n=1 Tax=Aeromonas veronii TaxID=654 RepID=UPI002B45DAF7|nr:DNA sulfur modification protein DndB [Aeromonas veronii]